MKQKKNNFFSSESIDIVAFRDQIEDAINILFENGLLVSIQDDKHTYDSIDEVIDNVGVKPDNIEIQGRNKETYESLELRFDKNEVRIHSHGSEQMYSLGYRMTNFFSQMTPWHYKVFNPWIFAFISVSPMGTIEYAFNENEELIRPWIIVLIFCSYVLWLLSYLLRKYNYGIRLIKRHHYGFWRRNKDNLVVSIISVLVGTVMGIIGTLLIQYLSR